MFDTPQSYDEKPYNLCLHCTHIGKKCDGPNFLAMSTERWCEWVKLRKEYLGWTNAKIAEQAEISKVSVDRIMAGNIKDIRTTTMQAVTKALVNGTWGQYPCALAALQITENTDNTALSCECEHLRRELETVREQEKKKVDYLTRQLEFVEKQLEAKDELLKDRCLFMKRKDKIITFLSITLAIFILFIFFDLLNGHIGYFRY